MPYTPTATYRLQLHAGFTFADAEALVPYLHALGVSDVYASPFLKASPGSTHGYDICDHGQLNPEIGDEAAFLSWTDALARHGIGLVVDVVPNHMGLNPDTNRWWRSVLTHGASSPYADYFDIDWHPLTPELNNRVLLPILQDPYGAVLERGEIRLAFADGEFAVEAGGYTLPVDPATTGPLLRDIARSLAATGAADEVATAVASLAARAEGLPATTARDPEARAQRQQQSAAMAHALDDAVKKHPAVREALEALLARTAGTPGDARSFDALHALLDAQPYRLAFWRTAADEINYRRFFDINDLGGLCMERVAVFHDTHRLLFRWMQEGRVTGVRIDHPDGLYDPIVYFHRLQQAAADRLPPTHRVAAEEGHGPLYVVAEKILTDAEHIPADWPIAGTSGYSFLNVVNGVFVDRRNELRLRRLYERVTRQPRDFADEAYHARRLIMASSMASELNVLAEALRRIAVGDRVTRDYTLNALRRTLLETAACFPVYRSYVNERGFSAFDRDVIDLATDRARRRNPAMASALFLFLRSVLLAVPEHAPAGVDAAPWVHERRRFAMKFQQFTAPVRAKGLEDTAFYRAPVLLSLNEVGGEPGRFGHPPELFHAGNRVRLERWPLEMIGTSTHDTKRGEDARARVNVISELPDLWQRQVFTWMRVNAGCKTRVEGAPAPDRTDEYLYYQSLLGAFPAELLGDTPLPEVPAAFIERMQQFMLKAIKEAKRHTSWVSANPAYEEAVSRFVEATLSGRKARAFLEHFLPLARPVARAGMVNSLAQLTLKMASPGVADIYQGSELWNWDLADPDNRRPVNFAARRGMLRELEPCLSAALSPLVDGPDTSPGTSWRLDACVAQWLEHWTNGRIKQYVTACGLRVRRAFPDLIVRGTYQPLPAHGLRADHVVAFARAHNGHALAAVVPRLVARLPQSQLPIGQDVWADTSLQLAALDRAPAEAVTPGARATWRNLLTGRCLTPREGEQAIPLADVLDVCPVALLWRER